MSPILRNVLAALAGLVVGSFVNMGIIMAGGSVVPPPPGVDTSNMASLKAGMHLFQPVHFLPPFLAHALGTLGIAVAFRCGGVAAAFMLPAPAWFTALDLVGAYLPMGWLGWRLAKPRA